MFLGKNDYDSKHTEETVPVLTGVLSFFLVYCLHDIMLVFLKLNEMLLSLGFDLGI